MLRKMSMLVAVCTLCTMMAGCLEIEEKVAIAQDGQSSSLLRLRLYLPKGGKKDAPRDLDIKSDGIGKGIDGFEAVKVSTREVFGQLITEIAMKARSWKALAEAYNTLPREPEKKEQGVDVEQLFTEKGFYQLKKRGKTILITRTFEPTKKPKGKTKKGEEGMGDLVAMMMGSMKLRLELDLPSDVVSSNAEEQDGNRLTWVVPLDYLSKNKVVLKAEIKATPELVKALF